MSDKSGNSDADVDEPEGVSVLEVDDSSGHITATREAVSSEVLAMRTEVCDAEAKARLVADQEIESKVISLVRQGDAVRFVRWTRPSQLKARAVTIDKQGRIVTIVPMNVMEEEVRDAEFIIKNTGAVMLRATARFRADMHKWCLLLRDLHQARWHRNPITDAVGRRCLWCAQLAKTTGKPLEHVLPPMSADGSPPLAFRCVSCSVPWHAACASVAFPSVVHDGRPFVCGPCLAAGPLGGHK